MNDLYDDLPDLPDDLRQRLEDRAQKLEDEATAAARREVGLFVLMTAPAWIPIMLNLLSMRPK